LTFGRLKPLTPDIKACETPILHLAIEVKQGLGWLNLFAAQSCVVGSFWIGHGASFGPYEKRRGGGFF
jgi:hypothetical protein